MTGTDTDLENAFAEAYRLHARLLEGHLPAYLDLHRLLADSGLHPTDIGTTNASLRRAWRAGILAEAKAALEELER